MQERNSEQTVPLSLMFKEICSAEKNSKEDHTESMSEASSHDSFYDSLSDLKEGQMNSDLTSELSAFLSQDEINKSLDLAREAFPGPETEKLNTKQESTKLLKHSPRNPSDNVSFMDTKVYKQREIGSPLMNNQRSKTTDRFIRKQTTTSNSQTSKSSTVANERKATISPLLTTSPSLIRSLQTKSSFKNSGRHSSSPQRQVLKSKSLNQGEPASQNDLRNKAATFIEELSSIFRESAKSRSRSPDGDSSSPDSGYLSPKKKQSTLNDTTLNDNSKSFAEPQKDAMSEAKMPTVNPTESSPVSKKSEPVIQHQENISGHQVASLSGGPPSVPRFTQKLRSQEVAEGSSVRLECRVAGNPTPQVRWFCEGKELHNSPDIQICSERGNLHSLVITEAFEDDTGRYTCTASNSLGLDTTSAEVFVEGASSTDSESEGSVFKSNLGAMPQAQKKTTSVSLTIGCSSPKAGVTTTVIQPLSVPVQQVQSPTSYLYRQDGSSNPAFSPPIFTKELQNITASEGQVVVLECRVKATPPLQVKWFQQGTEIHDSPDFRVLQKKPRSAAEPEEICTLVIAEAFPEDAGTFTCTARNEYGSVTCSSLLTVYSASSDGCGNDMSAREENNEDFQQFPPPPPVTELSCLELPPKKPHESLQFNHTEFEPSLGALQLQLSAAGKSANGVHPSHGINGMSNSNTAAPSPHVLLSPTKQPPPILAKPKLDPLQIQQLQNQIRLEQEVDWWNLQQQTSPQQNPPSSPSFPPPPSFQELESSQFITSPVQMNVLSSHNSPTMQPASSFNYARPKQFIAAQSMSPASGYVTPSSGSSTSSLPSPMSPPATQKQFGRASVPPFSQPFAHEGDPFWSPSSPSPPPPPPPVISPTATYAGSDSFPLPPPPPPLPGAAPSPNYSPSPSPTSRFSNSSQSPAAFLSSMLPSQQSPTSLNVLGLPKGVMPMGFPKKSGRTARIASDEEIQGTKDAVIQDLERKLRFKEELLNNGQPRLTYEEKMARRLLGADSAATVFQLQEPEEELSTQDVGSHDVPVVSPIDTQKEYKVSSFEQRLISEIEYRLERSPVEESDDEVQHLDKATDSGVAPQFQMKLKHYKIFEGMPVTFTCKVTGDPKPKIYWFKDGKQISVRSDHYKIQREPDGTCSLHTTASALDDDGNYTIMAANPQGRVSCTGRLMVQAVNQRGRSPRTPPGQAHIRRPRSRSRDSGDENEPIQERFFRPHFLQAPGDLIVQEGKLCRMDCKVSGLPTPDLSWQLNGRPVRPDSSHKMLVRENGVHSLIIEPVTARDAGIYSCVATNRAGQNSFSLELIVAAKDAHKPPVFVEKLQNTGVAEGYPVRLECRVSGAPPPQIFWKKENESLTYNTDRVSMHQDNYGYICLLIQGTTKEDAGWYTVSAKNEAGIVACTARLDVYPQWQQQPHITKPKKVRPSASRYAALSDQGLDIKAAFQPEANPVHMQAELVESDDL